MNSIFEILTLTGFRVSRCFSIGKYRENILIRHPERSHRFVAGESPPKADAPLAQKDVEGSPIHILNPPLADSYTHMLHLFSASSAVIYNFIFCRLKDFSGNGTPSEQLFIIFFAVFAVKNLFAAFSAVFNLSIFEFFNFSFSPNSHHSFTT
jgi:hypothetical protein